MKKHPIDELFAQKLAETRMEPSERALHRFQERLNATQKPVRRLGVVWYWAAAGIMLAATTSIFLQNQSTTHDNVVAISTNNETQVQANSNKPIVINSYTEFAKIRTKSNTKNQIIPVEKTIQVSTAVELPIVEEQIAPKQELAEIIQDNHHEAIVGQTLQPIIALQEDEIILTIEEVKPLPNQNLLLLFDDEPTQLAENLQQAPDTKLPDSFEEPRPVYTQVWEQWQHFKRGESIDWSILGLKSRNKVMAKKHK